MRPSARLLILLLLFLLLFVTLGKVTAAKRVGQEEGYLLMAELVSQLGLSDLALSTEARYTRHPATSDSMVVIMDHPGGIDHFPSTLFWAPVQ